MIALRNLLRRKTRSILTLLGISVGISAIVALISISSSLETQVMGIFNDYRIDVIVQAKGVSSPKKSIIPLSEIDNLAQIEGIEGLSGVIMGSTLIGSSELPGVNPAIAVGVSSIHNLSSKLDIIEGRLLEPGKNEIVLGSNLARELECRAGGEVLINERDFTVAGIVSSGSSIFDAAALLDISDALIILKIDNYVNMALIRTSGIGQIKKIIQKINKKFPRLSAYRLGEFIGQNRLLNTVKSYTRMIAIMILIISSIVIMNTLVLAVSERKKEIGILMAVGWSRFMVMKTIIAESIMVCFAGGILGAFLGMLLLWIFYHNSRALGMVWMQVPVFITLGMMLKTIGLSIILGFVSSLYPAILASKRFPIEALRSE